MNIDAKRQRLEQLMHQLETGETIAHRQLWRLMSDMQDLLDAVTSQSVTNAEQFVDSIRHAVRYFVACTDRLRMVDTSDYFEARRALQSFGLVEPIVGDVERIGSIVWREEDGVWYANMGDVKLIACRDMVFVKPQYIASAKCGNDEVIYSGWSTLTMAQHAAVVFARSHFNTPS